MQLISTGKFSTVRHAAVEIKRMDDTERCIKDLMSSVYDISKVSGVLRINGGEWNRIYRIDSQPIWILRISHHRKIRSQLEFELSILTRLSESLSYVPQIRLTKDGQLFGVHKGLLCSLFAYMPGQILSVTDKTVTQAGAILGEIHRELAGISKNFRLVDDLSIINFDWFNNYMYKGEVLDAQVLNTYLSIYKSTHLNAVVSELEFLQESRTLISSWLSSYSSDNGLGQGIIHGDYYRRNILTDGKHISAVLDWDETITSWVEYEIANAVWEFARDDSRCTMNPKRQTLFLDAFTSEYGLSALNIETINWFIGVRRLIEIQLELYELVNDGQYDLEYCEMNVKYLKNLGLDAA